MYVQPIANIRLKEEIFILEEKLSAKIRNKARMTTVSTVNDDRIGIPSQSNYVIKNK